MDQKTVRYLAGRFLSNYQRAQFRLSELPYHHDDAIDRILVATALAEELPIVTDDENIKKYPVSIIW